MSFTGTISRIGGHSFTGVWPVSRSKRRSNRSVLCVLCGWSPFLSADRNAGQVVATVFGSLPHLSLSQTSVFWWGETEPSIIDTHSSGSVRELRLMLHPMRRNELYVVRKLVCKQQMGQQQEGCGFLCNRTSGHGLTQHAYSIAAGLSN